MDNNKIINLGCRLNIYEGEIIKNHLSRENIGKVTVINSCAVTAEAEKKVLYEIRRAKKSRPSNKIIVTGCAAQINPDKYKEIDNVDIVIGNTEKVKSQTWKKLSLLNKVNVANILEEKKTVSHQLRDLREKQEHILKYNKVVIIVVLSALFLSVEETTEVYQLEK